MKKMFKKIANTGFLLVLLVTLSSCITNTFTSVPLIPQIDGYAIATPINIEN